MGDELISIEFVVELDSMTVGTHLDPGLDFEIHPCTPEFDPIPVRLGPPCYDGGIWAQSEWGRELEVETHPWTPWIRSYPRSAWSH